VFSYPITPQTLRKLILGSTYIVIAKIDNPNPIHPFIYFDKEKNDSVIGYSETLGGDGLADLYIEEVIKGELLQNHIIVKYENNMSNPKPPRYPDREIVLAFLTKDDTSSYFRTFGLSYGTKIFKNPAIMISYKNKIVDYLEILKIPPKRKQRLATVEWLVQCCEDIHTRWEGAYELARNRHWASYYDQSKDPNFSRDLNKMQRQRLDSIVFSADTINYNQLCLTDFVGKKNYSKLRELLIKNLDFAYFSIAKDLMKKYIDITSNSQLKKIYKKAENLYSLGLDDEQNRKKVVADFIATAMELN
jgi:hypothetical protein